MTHPHCFHLSNTTEKKAKAALNLFPRLCSYRNTIKLLLRLATGTRKVDCLWMQCDKRILTVRNIFRFTSCTNAKLASSKSKSTFINIIKKPHSNLLIKHIPKEKSLLLVQKISRVLNCSIKFFFFHSQFKDMAFTLHWGKKKIYAHPFLYLSWWLLWFGKIVYWKHRIEIK